MAMIETFQFHFVRTCPSTQQGSLVKKAENLLFLSNSMLKDLFNSSPPGWWMTSELFLLRLLLEKIGQIFLPSSSVILKYYLEECSSGAPNNGWWQLITEPERERAGQMLCVGAGVGFLGKDFFRGKKGTRILWKQFMGARSLFELVMNNSRSRASSTELSKESKFLVPCSPVERWDC